MHDPALLLELVSESSDNKESSLGEEESNSDSGSSSNDSTFLLIPNCMGARSELTVVNSTLLGNMAQVHDQMGKDMEDNIIQWRKYSCYSI